MNKKYLVCSICKKQIKIRPSFFIDSLEKEWWVERNLKSYWRNKYSGKIYCNECINFFLEKELCLEET